MQSITRIQKTQEGLSVVYDVDQDGNVQTREEWDPSLTKDQIKYRKGKVAKQIAANTKAIKLERSVLFGGLLIRALPILAELAKGTQFESEAKKLLDELDVTETDVESQGEIEA